MTGTRAEYGILRPVLRAIMAEDALSLRLLVCGTHLSQEFGHTVERIENDGIPVAGRIETLPGDDSAEAAARSIAAGVSGFAHSFAAHRPDMLLLTADRPEMLAAAGAALNFAIPVAHLHGGELTFGAVDDAIRHALTKLSHLHFVATETYARRVIQMGEDPGRVHVTGAPGLDNIREIEPLDDAALAGAIGMPLEPAPLLCTFHPVTLEAESTMDQLAALLGALADSGRPVVMTYPNSDPLGRRIIAAIEAFAAAHAVVKVVPDLGTRDYFSLMRRAAAMVGNSSSGITEAASFELPVVNIGSRQAGRLRAANVIDARPERNAILAAIGKATSPGFRATLNGLANPYGDGHAAARIVAALRDTPTGPGLMIKQFQDFELAG